MLVNTLASLFLAVISASLTLASPHTPAVGFAADPAINAKGILAAAKASRSNVIARFPSGQGGSKVNILADWENLNGVSAIHFIADMDVDCDGVDFKCNNNPDGQPQTSFGHLDARTVPFYVLPASFHEAHSSKIKPNALGAIVCDDKMFYGIFGDEDGDNPEVIGEASLLMAQTCFPNDGLDGGTGHSPRDVLYVVFGRSVPSGVGDKTIDIAALKKLGDKETRKLAKALGV